jgi:hypothetical protein
MDDKDSLVKSSENATLVANEEASGFPEASFKERYRG